MWLRWALLESGSRASSKLLQKIIGNVSATVGDVFFATFIIGVVQVITGCIAIKARRGKFLVNSRLIIGSIAFGIFAVIATVLGFATFLKGGEIGISTFIITLSIVPGAIIDSVFFHERLTLRKCAGIGIAIFAGYSILGWPSINLLLSLPLWVLLSVLNMAAVAINQGVTRSIKTIDQFTKNFWGGLTTVVLCFVTVVGLEIIGVDISYNNEGLLIVSAAIGLIVVSMWSFNVLSYKDGAAIALKNIVVNGSYLSMAMILGVVIFNETFTVGKLIGMLLYFAAFSVMDNNSWKFLSRKILTRKLARQSRGAELRKY